MKKALEYIDLELEILNILLEKYDTELYNSELITTKQYFAIEIKVLKAQILQLENIKKLLQS